MSSVALKTMKTLDAEVGQADGVKHRKRSGPVSPWRIATYVVLGLYTLWIFAPFLIILVTSFTTNAEYGEATSYIWWPQDFSIEGWTALFMEDPYMVDGVPSLLRGFINTLWITLVPLVSGLLQSLLVAYCYWQERFPFKNSLFMFTIMLMFVPLGAFGFVGYMFYQNLGWTEGYAAYLPLIVPGLFASASTVFFLRPYLDGISGEIVEAAKIDGMNFWQIFFTIVIPLSKSALIAQFIFGFVGGYNNYAGALMYLDQESETMWTLQLVLQKLIKHMSTSANGDYNFRCATSLMAMIPLVIVYLACQRFFIEGISFGGGKE